jgi:peptidoglycan/xylan/chitin deacetylase (PgdA/CDA1 family)
MKTRALAVPAVILALVLVAGLAGARALARSKTVQLFGRLVPRVETSDRVVALTFDDGPTSDRVDALLSVLASRQVRATFFVTGAGLTQAPEAGRKLVAAGHELGNHSYHHKHMVLRRPGFFRDEVERTDALIRSAGAQGEIYFRPPYGYKLLGLPWYLSRTGRTTVTWDVEPDSNRKAAASADGMVQYAVERTRPGSIILVHPWFASRETSRAAVPLIIDALQAHGFRFVTVGELMRAQPAP